MDEILTDENGRPRSKPKKKSINKDVKVRKVIRGSRMNGHQRGGQTTTSLPSCFPPSRWRQRRLVRPSPRLKPRPSRQGVAAYTARRPEGGAIELCVGLVMGSVASKLQDSRANSLPVFPPSLTRLRKTSSANSTRLRRRSPCTCCPRRHVP